MNNSDSDSDWSDDEALISVFHSICDPSKELSTLQEAIEYDEENYQFFMLELIPVVDFYSALKFVNFCRRKVRDIRSSGNNESVGGMLKASILENVQLWDSSNDDDDDDEEENILYKPVLESDGFLMNLDDVISMAKSKISSMDNEKSELELDDKDDELEDLRAQVSALQCQLSDAKTLIASLSSQVSDKVSIENSSDHNIFRMVPSKDNDTYYFTSYGHYGIHEQMLKDRVRTGAYESAICGNPNLFKGKTVLDVGCGTGVLSIFAARSGAKKVISVDDSKIINHARKIVEANGLEKIITLVRGKIEEVNLPLVKGEVDVIVSEWMGYALFFETMLPSVLSARDRFMNPSGTMFPNACQIFLEGGSDNRLDYWNNVHGIDMSVMREPIELELTTEAQVQKFDASAIVTNRVELIAYDLNACLDSDLDFKVPFSLTLQNDEPKKVDVLVVSFDIDFNHNCTQPVSFSTGCQATTTHWYQTLLWIEPRSAPVMYAGETLTGTFRMVRNSINPREMDFHVVWNVIDGVGKIRCDGSIRSKLGAEE